MDYIVVSVDEQQQVDVGGVPSSEKNDALSVFDSWLQQARPGTTVVAIDVSGDTPQVIHQQLASS